MGGRKAGSFQGSLSSAHSPHIHTTVAESDRSHYVNSCSLLPDYQNRRKQEILQNTEYWDFKVLAFNCKNGIEVVFLLVKFWGHISRLILNKQLKVKINEKIPARQ